ncbi:hypothetical protein [Haliangium sp. UPWRP_2]|uniref:hypothetical protein n=1 Tax=Haliangium sp. UPWRP_2 TaxID=1931276 RepID=UPI0011B20370|nr:hypothetical protein [Haliangium sp. UPWRP_2]HNN90793.1 hypothetical protein [Pseudomonadota bacterium]
MISSDKETIELLQLVKDSFPQKAELGISTLMQAGLSKVQAQRAFRQIVEPADVIPETIPTLDDDCKRTISPSLVARFCFAGSWQQGPRKWLNLSEMAKAAHSKKIVSTVQAQRKHWDGSAPNMYPDRQLTVFSVVPGEEENITYLLWIDGVSEPQIWDYVGQSENRYSSLNEYLKHIVAD